MEEKPKFKTVQEVVAANEGLPERYLQPLTGGHEDQPLNGPVPEMDIPSIDLSLLLSSSEEGRQELSDESWNYRSVSRQDLDKIYKLTKQFFALPTEEKQKYAGDIGKLHTFQFPRGSFDFVDLDKSFFRETLHEYTMKQHAVIEQFFKGMARSLDLEDNVFLEMHGDNARMDTRFNTYPPCPTLQENSGILTDIPTENEILGIYRGISEEIPRKHKIGVPRNFL
ncbi:hypothetical protein F2Q69_00000865 [Brassica cretica]|uniref:Non-haem dioxygenase N-terminal domain-containing protein n=1 Tax=Brassica cretica TaxID=69181 RepID=A0A8S9NVQ0_BRACR|nr:hypothetical protein F2Q69_00000865 [Brassica cretica]